MNKSLKDKNIVGLEQHVCLVCNKTYDTGTLLLSTRFKDIPERPVTGFGMCPEHQQLKDDGYIAMIGVDPERSKPPVNGNINPEDAYRTGSLIHMRAEVFTQMFNCPVPPQGIAFVEQEVINWVADKLKGPEQGDSPCD